MLPQSATVHNAPHDTTTPGTSSRNKNRNRTPCGSCTSSKVRCIVSHPYTKLLCKRCQDDGRTECENPYVQKNRGRRRAPYRKRNRVPPTERTDGSDINFMHKNMSSSNNTEVSQAGGVGSGEIASMSENNANVSAQDVLVPSARQIQYSDGQGYGETVSNAETIGSASSNIASTSTVPANSFEVPNANAIINNETAVEHQLCFYNWLDFLNRTVDGDP